MNCPTCDGKGFWTSKEGAEIPCNDCPYRIDVKPDGTWLILRGPTKQAAIRLESDVHGPIVLAAVAEVRAVLGEGL